MYDIIRKFHYSRYVPGEETGRLTLQDDVWFTRSLDGEPQSGCLPFDVARFDKSVVKDPDIRRNFERANQEKHANKPWVNKWARE